MIIEFKKFHFGFMSYLLTNSNVMKNNFEVSLLTIIERIATRIQ